MFKVLVIDDTEDVRMLTTDMLAMNGYDVTAVASGMEGLETARRCPPDLVLCDVQMPEWDGFETFAQLRAVPSIASIPFIFLTGMGDKPLIRRGMELGADDYLTKPFTLAELLGAVRTQLDKKAAITEQAEQKLDQLRGNISTALPHELLTPLTAIIGFSSLIVEDHATMPPAEMVESARHIHQSAVRLRRMIENFLLCAQIDLAAADPGRLAGIRAARCPALPETLERAAARVAAEQRREGDFQFMAAPARAGGKDRDRTARECVQVFRAGHDGAASGGHRAGMFPHPCRGRRTRVYPGSDSEHRSPHAIRARPV